MADPQYIGTGGLAAALAQGERLLRADPAAAAAQAKEILAVTPGVSAGLRLLARAQRRLGRQSEAERTEVEAACASLREPMLAAAARALAQGQWQEAETWVRRRLGEVPDDAAALVMLGEIAAEVGVYAEAERLVKEALRHAPRFAEARLSLARIAYAQGRVGDSLAVAEEMLADEPDSIAALTFIGFTLGLVGAYDDAIGRYETFLEGHEGDAALWIAYGNVLKTVGRTEDGIAAYRRAIALDPRSGDAWWGLANLKSGLLEPADVARMTQLLEGEALAPGDRIQLHFALGRALEDAGDAKASFRHYEAGNSLKRAVLPYDPSVTTAEVAKAKALFTPAFFAAHSGHGDPSPAPIFILGLPRAGSTLIEQILASHSSIEGTAELPYIPALARELAATRSMALRMPYPEILAQIGAEESRALGRLYLERAAAHRRSGQPHFIDKLPNNWLDIGFIHQILPNAKIIDARRAPLACCWSNYKQHFAGGQAFSYDLADLGLYYRDYVDLLAHFDEVLPGRVHRLIHERLIAEPEAEIRGLLAFLGLDYEPACLNFHENPRAVRTASSEQVRRPISAAGLHSWRAFEPWLQPLKDALGPLAESETLAPES